MIAPHLMKPRSEVVFFTVFVVLNFSQVNMTADSHRECSLRMFSAQFKQCVLNVLRCPGVDRSFLIRIQSEAD